MAGVNYRITLTTSEVRVYPRGSPDQTVASSLHDTGRVIVLDEEIPSDKRILILFPNTVEVYLDDNVNYRCIYVESLNLPAECDPRYLLKGSRRDSGEFFVSYHGNCHPTLFVYSNQNFEMVSQQDFDGPNIVVATKDEYDVLIDLNEQRDQLNIETSDLEFRSKVLASSIGECALVDSLYPFNPFSNNRVYFAVNCTTSLGDTKQYHVAYQYRFGTELIETEIATGIPVGDGEGRYFGVRGGELLTVYDVGNLESGVPVSTILSGTIEQIQFHAIRDRAWLSVSMENINVVMIDVEPFITSLGVQGMQELPDTNIGVCDPTCLPQIVVQGQFVVSAFNKAQQKYSYVGFSFDSPDTQETLRVEGIPGRPLHAVFIEDPNLTPPPPTTSNTTVPSTDPVTEPTLPQTDLVEMLKTILPAVIVPVLVIVALIVIIAAVVVHVRNQLRKDSTSSVQLDGQEHGGHFVSGTELPQVLPLLIESQGVKQTETMFAGAPRPAALSLHHHDNVNDGNIDYSDIDDGIIDDINPTTPLLTDERSLPGFRCAEEVDRAVVTEEQGGTSVEETEPGAQDQSETVMLH